MFKTTKHLTGMLLAVATFVGGLSVAPLAAASDTTANNQPAGFDPDRHMRVDEVKPGMRGYGMSVFHGTKPEPFPVEVVSVQRGFEPGKSVVWIRCPGDRMQLTGPVQGMSGSPIYLWPDTGDTQQSEGEKNSDQDDGEAEHELGKGGRMIGAFAFGHRNGKDCYAGVQPIANMLRTAGRATTDADSKGQPAQASSDGTEVRDKTLAALHTIANRLDLSEAETWRLDAISELVGYKPSNNSDNPASPSSEQAGDPHQLALPVTVGSAEQASLLQPLLAPHGLAARATPNSASQLPPSWIGENHATLEPGSVFAIPLTFGPLEMSAIGTTTEVLPDGTALAFGHSFFAQGPIAVPMATGFVHFVQPANTVSFKLGGSVKVQGAVVRDETSAIVGKPKATYPTLPAKVKVRWPNESLNADYDYQVVHHKRLVPSLVGSLAASSLISDVELPEQNTIALDAEVRFSNGETLRLEEIVPRGSPGRVLMALIPALSTMIDNDYDDVRVEGLETTIRVEREVREAELLNARLDRSIVHPGEKVVIHARLKPYREPAVTRRVELTVPRDTPEGKYNLTVGGADAYQQLLAMMKPHLNYTENVDQLFEAVRQILSVRSDALYSVLRLNPNESLAVGRSELPELPSSRMAMLGVESSSETERYIESVEKIERTPWVVRENVSLPLEVRKENTGNNNN